MKKIILAIENKKLEDKLKENNNIKIICNNLQYREAILEILDKNKNIDFILINENLPGIISIEELVKKIKIINNKINIIIFLEKDDINKINRLKKLNINNIYLNKKININKIINLILKNNKFNNNYNKNNLLNYKIKKEKINNNKLIKINNFKNNKFNKLKIILNKIKLNKNKLNNNIHLNNKNKKENKLITIIGKRKTGKSTIINLLLIYLLQKNKKILLINLNKQLENNYLILFGKKYYKIKNNYFNKYNLINNKLNKKNIFLKSEIKINNNLFFLNNFQKIIQQNNYNNILEYFTKYYIKKYDYVLVDIGDSANRRIKQKIVKISDKNIMVMTNDLLGIKEVERLSLESNLKEDNKENSLHIILNKYYFNSISNSIFKNLVKRKIKFSTIFYNKKFINLSNKILKNRKFNFNLFFKNKLKNILK